MIPIVLQGQPQDPPDWAIQNRVTFIQWMTQLDWQPMFPPFMGTCPICGSPAIDMIAHSGHHADIWFSIDQLQKQVADIRAIVSGTIPTSFARGLLEKHDENQRAPGG